MIRITISAEAYTAMAATLPGNVGIERQRAQNSDVYIWLDPGIVNRLKVTVRPARELQRRDHPRCDDWRRASSGRQQGTRQVAHDWRVSP
jgi:hypothetical protein